MGVAAEGGGMVLHARSLLAQMELHALAYCLHSLVPMGHGPVPGRGPGVGDPWCSIYLNVQRAH